MTLRKESIRAAFAEAAATYDGSSSLQQEVCAELARFVRGACAPPAAPGLILDAGCGTGRLGRALEDEYNACRVVSCDFAQPMLIEARLKDCEAALVGGDMDSLPFAEETFDIVASNLAFQWTAGGGASFKEAARVLKPGGLLAFTTLGTDTLRELRESCAEAGISASPVPFIGMDALPILLDRAGLETVAMDRRPITREYPDMRGLIKTLRLIGAAPRIEGAGLSLATGTLLRKAGQVYLKRYPAQGNGVAATYDVIFCGARKGI
ncbi:MAG: methyltransferase domain-containing protein [Deltaproteobacteria bacterium]|nr:methyltransferase domain-containing protein [Deltaproteobacteria bacterium]